jgi:hypothetical protein
VDPLDLQRIQHADEVGHEAIEREAGIRPRVSALARTAQIHPDHAKVTTQVGHPSVNMFPLRPKPCWSMTASCRSPGRQSRRRDEEVGIADTQ